MPTQYSFLYISLLLLEVHSKNRNWFQLLFVSECRSRFNSFVHITAVPNLLFDCLSSSFDFTFVLALTIYSSLLLDLVDSTPLLYRQKTSAACFLIVWVWWWSVRQFSFIHTWRFLPSPAVFKTLHGLPQFQQNQHKFAGNFLCESANASGALASKISVTNTPDKGWLSAPK